MERCKYTCEPSQTCADTLAGFMKWKSKPFAMPKSCPYPPHLVKNRKKGDFRVPRNVSKHDFWLSAMSGPVIPLNTRGPKSTLGMTWSIYNALQQLGGLHDGFTGPQT